MKLVNIIRISTIFSIIILDQIVKRFMISVLKPAITLPFIPGFVRLYYLENRGAAFGILQIESLRWFFIALSTAAIGLVIFMMVRNSFTHCLAVWGLTLVVGGAIGNLIDRVLWGYVVDFFEFEFVSFAVFNVADIFITIGGFMTCVYFVFFHYKSSLPNPPDKPESAGGQVN